jgi:Dullard-like phosphatase family protein
MSFRRLYGKSGLSKTRNRFNISSKPLDDSLPRLVNRTVSASNHPSELSFMVNLEDFVILEQDLFTILDKFASPSLVLSACEDVWDLTSENTMNRLSSLFRDERTRDAIRYAMALQAVCVSLLHYFVSEYTLNHDMVLLMKSMTFSVHQGFLIITKFVLSRVPDDSSNPWTLRLREIIKEKKLRKHNIDNTSFLEHYNLLVVNNLKKMCRNFISKAEDPTVKALKITVLQIVRNKDIGIAEARALVDKAFGIKREALEKMESVKEPFITTPPEKPYTLVLDLDETLVHYIDTHNRGKYLPRPFVNDFLSEMAEFFEIVVFTASLQDYADWILDDLDKEKVIRHRLYRHHTIPAGTFFLKDLNKIGRDIRKVVIVDNVSENFQFNSENGILIKSWYEDQSDTALKELAVFLKQIWENKIEDVRVFLNNTRKEMLKGYERV